MQSFFKCQKCFINNFLVFMGTIKVYLHFEIMSYDLLNVAFWRERAEGTSAVCNSVSQWAPSNNSKSNNTRQNMRVDKIIRLKQNSKFISFFVNNFSEIHKISLL